VTGPTLRNLVQLEGLTPFEEAWEQQRAIHAEVVAGGPSTVLYVEHPSVFTAGKRTRPEDLPVDGSEVIEVDRGGRITWHGPGQLVAYPIVRLPDPVDVMEFVARLEAAVMRVCTQYGLSTVRVAGRTGVWLPAGGGRIERKIAAIGVRVARGVTMHGLALNANPDLDWFTRIVPCGIADADVTSLSAELDRVVTVAEVAPALIAELNASLEGWVE
jgi:lipoyl(octanoyl) transferase